NAGTGPGQGDGFKDWTIQRDLTDSLSTVEGLQNATFEWIVGVNDRGRPHVAFVDGINVQISFRPFGQLRPVRGCLTTRPNWRQDNIIGGRPGINPGYDWLDEDWGPTRTLNAPHLEGDQPEGDYTGAQAGNSPSFDDNDCPLIDVNNTDGRV